MNNYKADTPNMKYLKTKTFLPTGLLLSSFLCPAAFGNISLYDALKATFTNNPSLEAARKNTEAARTNKLRALADFLPTVQLNGTKSATNTKDLRGNPVSGAGPDNLSYDSDYPHSKGISVSQSLFKGGQSTANYIATNAAIQAKEAELKKAEQDTLFEAIQAYGEIWAAQNNLKVAQNGVKVFQHHLEAEEAKFKVGVSTLTEVARAKSKLLQRKAQLSDAKSKLTAAVAKFERVTGIQYQGIEEPSTLVKMPVSKEEMFARAHTSNPSLLMSENSLKEANAKTYVAKGQMLPSLDLEARIDKTRSQTYNFAQDTVQLQRSAVLKLRIPLFQGGAEYADIKRTAREYGAKQMELRAIKTGIQEGGEKIWASWQSAKEQVQEYAENIKAAEFMVEGVRQEHKFGTKTLYDVFVAEDDLLQAHSSHIQARLNEMLTSYQIISVMGELTAENLLQGGEASTAPSKPEEEMKTIESNKPLIQQAQS